MQLPASQLSQHLKTGLKPLYTVYGDELLLVQETLDTLRLAAREQGYGERNVHTVAGAHFNWGSVLAASKTLSLFSDKQLIEIRIPSGKPGKEGGAAIQELAQGCADNPDICTLVVLPRLDKATQSTAWFTALESYGVNIKIDAVERAALPAWISQRLQRNQQTLVAGEEGARTLQFFADCVEGNLLAAHQEVEKLALLYPPGELTFEKVQRAVLNVARYDVFKLSEAVLSGQRVRVQNMLEGLHAEGESEVLVHWALSEDIRALKRVQQAVQNGRPLGMALRENRIWGPKEKQFERIIPKINPQRIDDLLEAAHYVDGIVKGIKRPDWPTDPWQALHRLAMRLMQSAR